MRRFLKSKLASAAVLSLLFTLAFAINLMSGAASPAPFNSVAAWHGPTMPPDPWAGERVGHGPTMPPDPWAGLRVNHGPTMPPDPWAGRA